MPYGRERVVTTAEQVMEACLVTTCCQEGYVGGELETVSVYHDGACRSYASTAPFHPSHVPAGYLFPETYVDSNNTIYAEVLDLLQSIGNTKPGFENETPLSWLVHPGDIVVVKPNLVGVGHAKRPGDWDCIVTHGSLVRVIVDCVLAALKGSGKVVIVDSPQDDSDFEETTLKNGLAEVVQFYKANGYPVALLDLRDERYFTRDQVLCGRSDSPGDPLGSATIDLAEESTFCSYSKNGRFYGADYDTRDLSQYHSQVNHRHAYSVSKTCLSCDVFISLPKMKTHQKAGITLSMKNTVGICTHKNCLPHHSLGTPDAKGDEYPNSGQLERALVMAASVKRKVMAALGPAAAGIVEKAKHIVDSRLSDKQRVRSGNWFGNDTIWRTVVDLNRILLWYDADGAKRSAPRRYLSIVDGIVAGEGDGPMAPDRKPVGLLFGGTNPVAVDAVGARLMGFDYHKIPSIGSAREPMTLPVAAPGVDLDDIEVRSGTAELNGKLGCLKHPGFAFRPTIGWRGHIELDKSNDEP